MRKRQKPDGLPDDGGHGPTAFARTLWGFSDRQLAWFIQTNIGRKDGETARAVLEVKTLIEARRVAFWTMSLAIATFLLATATTAVLILDLTLHH